MLLYFEELATSNHNIFINFYSLMYVAMYVTGFEKSRLPCTLIATYLEILIYLFEVYLGKENRYLDAIRHDPIETSHSESSPGNF